MYNAHLGSLSREQIVDQMVEIRLRRPDYFLVIKETLTRMGIPSNTGNRLYQSCHIFQKKGRYFIVHFKEMLAMDGLDVVMTPDDIQRRDLIALQLSDWKLLDIVNPDRLGRISEDATIFILPHEEKKMWTLIPKYSMGKKLKLLENVDER